MKFGALPLEEALGAIVAHGVKASGLSVKKGTRLGTPEVERLRAAGVADVVVARLDEGDLQEDEAARRLAAAFTGEGVTAAAAFTGRCNLHAARAGILAFDAERVDAFNLVDESLTFATLPAFRAVREGELVATVKIIPFAVPGLLLEAALGAACPVVRVAPLVRREVAVISTLLPGIADRLVEKTLRVTGERVARLGARLGADLRVPHAMEPLRDAIAEAARAGAQAILIFGASAISDRADVIPAALEAAGGQVERLGMPVDPGNLLMLGSLSGVPVLGAPGCARSPKENGFDLVLGRLLADLPVTSRDIARMGAGGLISEIVTRPQPREEAPEPAPTAPAAVILAAGRGTRMGGANKLVEEVGGTPVVRRVAEAALKAGAAPVVVVTGHEAERVRAALDGLSVDCVDNPDYREGLATSLAAGIAALPEESSGAMVLLGDMPLVDSALLERMMAAFAPAEGRMIVVPVTQGRRGNPVLWARRFFPALRALEGDSGARSLILAFGEAVTEIEAQGPGAVLDVDTPEALAQARAALADEMS